jgi:carboxyl-terminal processing protease
MAITSLLLIAFFDRACCLADEQPMAANSTTTEPDQVYQSAWQIIKDSYFDQKFNGQNWDSWRHRYDGKLKTLDDAHLAIATMVGSLGDSKTRFLRGEQFTENKIQTEVHLFGVGLTPRMEKGKIVVAAIDKNSSAANEGLLPGDELVQVDGRSVSGLTLQEVRTLILGLINTKVTCTYRRPGSGLKRVTLTRAERKEQPIFSAKLTADQASPSLGYIRIATFEWLTCLRDLRRAVRELESCDGLVLDLRDNAGGLLATTTGAVELFLCNTPNGRFELKTATPGTLRVPEDLRANKLIIVSTIDADGFEGSQIATPDAIYAKPLVILINHRTAESAVIFAASLKENGRASLVGTHADQAPQLISSISKLPDGSGLDVSFAQWRSPMDNDFSGSGLQPDVVVHLSAKDKANGKGPWWSAPSGSNLDPANLRDVQLIKAIEVLKGSLTPPAKPREAS